MQKLKDEVQLLTEKLTLFKTEKDTDEGEQCSRYVTGHDWFTL